MWYSSSVLPGRDRSTSMTGFHGIAIREPPNKESHEFLRTRAQARVAACRGRQGLHAAHPHPAGRHSGRARRPRRARRRADRHRQDRRLRAADAAEPRRPRAAIRARWSSRPRANSPRRSQRACATTASTPTCAPSVIFGGVTERPQIDKLRDGCDILVATPGRLLDLAEQNALSLAHVQVFVLDEADRMLDMGFIHDIKRIRSMLPKQRQNLMFSATYSDDIRGLASNLLRNPLSIDVAPPQRRRPTRWSRSPTACRRTTSATCSRT